MQKIDEQGFRELQRKTTVKCFRIIHFLILFFSRQCLTMNHRTNSKYDHPSYKSAESWNFKSAPSGLKNCVKNVFLFFMLYECNLCKIYSD